MSDEIDGGENLVATLRKRGDEAEARAKALEAQVKELNAQVRTQSVTGILGERKLPAKVAKLIPDTVEATAEAVGAWLDEFGDVFGVQAAEPTAATETAPLPGISQDQANALRAVQQTQAQGVTESAVGLQKGLGELQKLYNSGLSGDALRAEIARISGLR